MPLPELITDVLVIIAGDPSVGIYDQVITIDNLGMELDCVSEEDREKWVEDVRQKLVEFGRALSGEEKVKVVFDFEWPSDDEGEI